jgi:glutaredoxin
MHEPRITLLTRAGCVQCAAAADALNRLCPQWGVRWHAVDVDDAARAGEPALRMEFGDRVPVVLLDRREHSYGTVDEDRLRADLTR